MNAPLAINEMLFEDRPLHNHDVYWNADDVTVQRNEQEDQASKSGEGITSYRCDLVTFQVPESALSPRRRIKECGMTYK
jgi:hypothetical protein